MASAYKVAPVTKTVVEVVEPARINLDLSIEEAEALTVILSKVGGDPELSARQHADTIAEALRRAGFNWYRLNDEPQYQKRSTGIWFFNRPEEPTKLRTLKDGDGDLWPEVEPNAFQLSGALYHPIRTYDYVVSNYGPVTEV